MSKKLLVVGAGPGGYVAAFRAAQLGAEVTVVEKENVGGTCLNWGCIPSKIMKVTADMLASFHQSQSFGVRVTGDIGPDMARLNARKQEIIRAQSQGILMRFKELRISYIKGHASIDTRNRATVRPEGAEAVPIDWDAAILAAGSAPRPFPPLPFDGRRILSSDDALYLDEVPASLLILGGGVIGCEFASIFGALGSRVILVEAMPRLLPIASVDEDCSKVLQREMKKRKIAVLVNRSVSNVSFHSDKVRVTIGASPFNQPVRPGKAEPETVEVDRVLVCIGRQPNTVNLGLKGIGIPCDDQGWVLADEQLQTRVPGVYAVGDILGPAKIMLAHVASREGTVAAENAMGLKQRMDYRVVPNTVFTQPEVADVGLTETQATERGYAVRADTVLFRTLGKAQVMGEIGGQVKIVSAIDSGQVLGVHIIGPRAADLIAEGTLAVQQGATVKDLAETIHAHPTLAEGMQEASLKALDRPLYG